MIKADERKILVGLTMLLALAKEVFV